MNKKVVIGMSGGVDSSVAAYLLKQQGYDVIGVTMKLTPDDAFYTEMEGGCCSLSAVEDARRVAYRIGIPFYVVNFTEIFKEKVIDYFTDEYLKGKTPNPCIACNKYIKFDALLKKAESLGADYIATGHYCRIIQDNGRYVIKKSEDDKKDQTYVMYNMTQEQLKHTLMPCGDYKKEHIREIAKEIGLNVFDKKDSEEICFIPDNDHGGFIKRECPKAVKGGDFVNNEGKILGKHKGIVYYTIGQRKGLGIAAGKRVFVTNIDAMKNQVVIGEEEEVFKDELISFNNNFIPFDKLTKPIEVDAKIRYNAKASKATIYPIDDYNIKVKFEKPQRAITKGQSVVFYEGDLLVGGGIIK
ncbi:tRNA 2-thiouridine(34) synthase MnmA [Clostridium felsineum]|uniref:tRNA 2-thiouridine(34) synthase MnmA n=1 Tax=Clostridium felsineum TaxID=36839 RepID=UPI00098C3535|nr:tRNA 2-thiouridine(34) synthase MnmA [Clostridium felsineum]URZ01005.1 tRNA-specific 2-thiouridylase MnmA [Clostridium felsineum]